MGPEAMGLTVVNFSWEDERACRNFLCGTCPHILFTNTKMDLGICPKSHTERLKTEYLAAVAANPNDPQVIAVQREHEQNIFSFTPEENAKTTNLMREIGEIELAIQGGMEKIESLGEQGKVEESMQEMQAVEALKAEKSEKERELQNLTETSGASGHQKLRVCEVCGAYLSVLDSDRRLADHFGGKMHLGYHELRNLLKKFADEREARRNAPLPLPANVSSVSMGPPGVPGAPAGPAADRDRDRDRDRGGYDRDRERSDRDKDRHRERDRDRDRGHDRDRERDRGDRDRDRDRYSSRHES
ncbi:LUC7-domain-containing protein [Auriculariales sp. MPI-PUGE-AT-0066]|nr:LUC7-domain-containing protein [Auriculariales sp. MPI-PUGE-AT-0066]